MKVAITGASGFLGRHVARHLAGRGYECRALIRPGGRHAPDLPPIERVAGTLDDPDALRALVAGADAVIHAAYDTRGGGFLDPDGDVVALVERNLVATVRLIEAARRTKVGRFLVVTSGAVHDEILDDRPLDEAHPLWPKSAYGAIKASLEAFVSSYGRGAEFPIAAVRPTAIYGLAEPASASRWYELVAAVTRGEPVSCRRGGKRVHAHDVARALEILLVAPGVAGEVYDCTDRYVADREVAEIARSVARTAGEILGEAPAARHPIGCAKLRGLGMTFGGRPLLETTVAELVAAVQAGR